MNYPAKDCILLVQLGYSIVGDEELRSIGVRATVGHRNHTSFVMFENIHKLILKRCAVDALPLLACSAGIASLNDESFITCAVLLILRWKMVLS